MEFQRGEDANKLLQSQSRIWHHILSFINSMSLKCAVQLGIPDAVHKYGQPMPLSKLIDSLPIHPSKTIFIQRLMKILVHMGFFSTKNVTHNELEVGYVLNDISVLLLKDHPFSLATFLVFAVDPFIVEPWHQLSAWFKNCDPTPFATANGGTTFWDYVGNVPKFNDTFNDGMASDAKFISGLVVEKCKGVFEGLESLVDVGGGTGTVAKAIAKAFPLLECTVFDQPHVVAGLEGSENLKYVGGDMFKEIPPSDGILLKSIFHDWNDEECVNILKKCKEAILKSRKGKEGKVIVIDIVMDDEKGDHELVESKLFFDMLMMALVNGKERNEEEWAKLIFSVGFSDYKISPILGSRSLIEIYP